jgi:hypothetical protein
MGTAMVMYTIIDLDIANGGVYNKAKVTGKDLGGNEVEDESEAPTPLGTEDPNYNPECPNCTYTDLPSVPDVTVVVLVNSPIINGVTDFNVKLSVSEINNVDTKGLITVSILKDLRWTFKDTYNQDMATLNGTSLDNGKWTYSQNDSHHIFTSTDVLKGGAKSTIGFEAVFDPRSENGIYTFTAQIVAGSGGEVRINNNSDAERIIYFIE